MENQDEKTSPLWKIIRFKMIFHEMSAFSCQSNGEKMKFHSLFPESIWVIRSISKHNEKFPQSVKNHPVNAKSTCAQLHFSKEAKKYAQFAIAFCG